MTFKSICLLHPDALLCSEAEPFLVLSVASYEVSQGRLSLAAPDLSCPIAFIAMDDRMATELVSKNDHTRRNDPA
jgi:uncharacterized membrane protein